MKTKRVHPKMLLVLFALFLVTGVYGQAITVRGTVVDTNSEPLVGVNVLVKKTTRGTLTNIDGGFTIQARLGEELEFSYVGYVSQSLKVTGSQLNVILQEDTQTLDEVLVVGYGVQKSRALTGSVSAVSPQSAGWFNYNGLDQEGYQGFKENRFLSVTNEPLSTFSIDVDVASYSNMRRFINNGNLPPSDAIRTEELINYFSYDYPQPTGDDPVAITAEIGECPWNKKHQLARIGLKAREIPSENLPASNFVFLIDVSGSMWGPTRLDLVKSSLKLLVNNLREEDQVSIVVYAGAAGEVLPATSGSNKQKIRETLDQLTAGGSTAGGAGIQLAYKIAEKNFIKGGNNRIILCTDGDFNVGVSSREGLTKMIEEKRNRGVFLTVLGYGMGNYKDDFMQILAEKGNGNHAYIDNLQEANKVLVSEFGSTMYTVAKDVKLQIEFNPAHVQGYRLVGYESRLLANEDFNDDTKDAGEMGAGHTVTAFYEIVPVGVKTKLLSEVDALKYQKERKAEPTDGFVADELLTIKLRYKEPDEDVSKKIECVLTVEDKGNISSDFRFAASVAMFGQLLKDSEFKGDASYRKVIALAETALDNDKQGYRREFVRLVETAKNMVN